MKVFIEKSDLVQILAKTVNIVEKKNTMPILVNVLLEAEEKNLKIFATDLEVSLTDVVSVKCDQPGKACVSAKSLFDLVKDLEDGTIQLTKKPNHWLEVKQNKNIYNIVGVSAEEYPVFPAFTTNQFIKISAETIKEMIEKTAFSVSTDETRYHLNGVYFERVKDKEGEFFRMVATDGHRLSMVDRVVPALGELLETRGVIIPRKGLNEVKKIVENIVGNVEIAIEGSQFILKHGKTILMIRLIEGKYPNYQQLIPAESKFKLNVSKTHLLLALKRISNVSNHKSKGITLSLTSGNMEITANNPEVGDGKEELEIKFNGEPMKISFNAKYIMDILNSTNDDGVEIQLNGQLSPGLITPAGDHKHRCVVMPMRI